VTTAPRFFEIEGEHTMRRAIKFVVATLGLAASAIAGQIDSLPAISLTACTNTTATAAATGSSEITSGKLYALYFDVTGVNTCTVNVATTADRGTGSAKTLLTKTGLAADGWYFPRSGEVNSSASAISDSSAAFPLTADKLVVTAHTATTTNSYAVKAYIFVER
jgi:hypothetical protein